MQKLLTFPFSKNISIYINDQSFNDIVRFEQLGPDVLQVFSFR